MLKRTSVMLLFFAAVTIFLTGNAEAERFRQSRNTYPSVPANSLYSADASHAPAFNQSWGRSYTTQDWNRFYQYPYITYPQNYWPQEYYRSADDLYKRYPPEMRIPIYNKRMYNYYKEPKPYHQGNHYIMDVF